MVLIEYVYVRSAAIYCIKNDSGLKSIFTFYSICLLFAGIYGILKKRIWRISVLRRQRTVYAVRRICRQKGSSNSVHDFRKGIQVQTKAQPVKAGVAKLNGPKRKTFFRMAAGCHRYFVTLFAELCAAKGVFCLETEQPFCVANSHFKKNQPSVLLDKE